MNIVILNTHYFPDEPGGAERSIRTLAETLRSSDDVTVICSGSESERSVHNGVKIWRRVARYQSPSLAATRIGKLIWHAKDSYDVSAAAGIGDLIEELRPDVLHTNNLSGFSVLVWKTAAKLRIPVVHTLRDFYLMCPKTTMMKNGHTCATPCSSCLPFAMSRRHLSTHVKHVVGISQFILKKHQANGYFADVPSSVIHNSFQTDAPAISLPDGPLKIGFLGRVVPAKGVELLIDAARILATRGLVVDLKIAGTGEAEYVESLKALASDLPITFMGGVQPGHFFPLLDLTVVPSIWAEPFGRVVIESMAFGKPVVVTKVGGMPELIAPNTGVVCAELTAKSIADGIERLMLAIKSAPASVYRATLAHSRNFDPRTSAASYRAAYTSAMA